MNVRISASHIASALGGLIIGFFVGQEYIKYEIRSAIGGVAASFQNAFSSPQKNTVVGPAEQSPPVTSPPAMPPPPKHIEPPPVEIGLLAKGFKPARPMDGDFDSITTLKFSLKNLTGKALRAFDGVVVFNDLLDNKVLAMSLAVNDPVAAGATMTWSGGLKYNQFDEADQQLRSADQANLKVKFLPKKFLFADGTSKEYSNDQ